MTQKQSSEIADMLERAGEREIADGNVDRLYYENELLNFAEVKQTVKNFIAEQKRKK